MYKRSSTLFRRTVQSMRSRQFCSRAALINGVQKQSNTQTKTNAYLRGIFAASVAVYSICNLSIAESAAQEKDTPSQPVSSRPANPNMTQFFDALKGLLPADQIEFDLEERKLRGKPWNSYHKIDNFPQAIVYPKNTEETSAIMQLCHQYDVPIVAFGGGTSLEGQTLTPHGGISLDFSLMKRILSLHEDDLDVTVEAGLGYVELNEQLRSTGLWFPLDPGPGASIGGMCACRCSGSTAVRYGSMRENVLNLTAVLADGTIITTGSRARKSSAGYDITRLLIGSEGTLAIITEITLKLHMIPTVSQALRIAFPNTVEGSGIYHAACTARDSLRCGVTVGRCELLDDTMIGILNTNSSSATIDAPDTIPTATSAPKLTPMPEVTTLLYEITGMSEAAVEEQKNVLLSLAKKHHALSVETFTTPETCRQLWQLRKECLWSAMARYPDRECMITDVCVPLTQLPQLIEESKKAIAQVDLPCPIVAHAGDGNFHVLIFFNPADVAEVRTAKQLADHMAYRAIAMGGTCTGEHGIGSGKKHLLRAEVGEETIAVMQRIKLALDEKQLLNADKIIDYIPPSSGNGGSSGSSGGMMVSGAGRSCFGLPPTPSHSHSHSKCNHSQCSHSHSGDDNKGEGCCQKQ